MRLSVGRQTAVALLLLGALALLLFGMTTRGFQAVTSDGARQLDLARSPAMLPAIDLIDATGARMPLAAASDGRQTLVTLLYTHCVTVCRSSASGQAYLQAELVRRGLDRDYRLLSISFDPMRDTPAVLQAYGRKNGADPALWRLATVSSAADLPALLDAFGVVVLPDGLGDYSHNAAYFLIDGEGRLARAYDIDRPDVVLADMVYARP
jgi:protein SCO1/2